jgi:hypothetical protein
MAVDDPINGVGGTEFTFHVLKNHIGARSHVSGLREGCREPFHVLDVDGPHDHSSIRDLRWKDGWPLPSADLEIGNGCFVHDAAACLVGRSLVDRSVRAKKMEVTETNFKLIENEKLDGIRFREKRSNKKID